MRQLPTRPRMCQSGTFNVPGYARCLTRSRGRLSGPAEYIGCLVQEVAAKPRIVIVNVPSRPDLDLVIERYSMLGRDSTARLLHLALWASAGEHGRHAYEKKLFKPLGATRCKNMTKQSFIQLKQHWIVT